MTEKEYINQLPANLRPLSPWAYFGYTILFSIPVVGFILTIVFALDNSNINRRNFARSYFCVLAIVLIIFLISLITGGAAAIFAALGN